MCIHVCMCMYVVICKIDHCIHIHWCIPMGLGHNDPWVESHMWPQQARGQRSSRGQWPLVQVFGKKVSISTYFDVFSNLILQWLHKYVIAKAGETRGSRTALLIFILMETNHGVWYRGQKSWTIFARSALPIDSQDVVVAIRICKRMHLLSLKNYFSMRVITRTVNVSSHT